MEGDRVQRACKTLANAIFGGESGAEKPLENPALTPEWDEDEEQYNEILKRIAPTTNDLMMVPT